MFPYTKRTLGHQRLQDTPQLTLGRHHDVERTKLPRNGTQHRAVVGLAHQVPHRDPPGGLLEGKVSLRRQQECEFLLVVAPLLRLPGRLDQDDTDLVWRQAAEQSQAVVELVVWDERPPTPLTIAVRRSQTLQELIAKRVSRRHRDRRSDSVLLLVQTPQLPVDVPSRPALSAALSNDGLQRQEPAVNLVRPRLPPPSAAFGDPVADAPMASRLVAPMAGRHFVLEPAWPALDFRHQVLGGRLHPAIVEWGPAPHADITVPADGLAESCAAPSLPNHTVPRLLLSSPH